MDIYSYIQTQLENFKLPVPVAERWDWNMFNHIRDSVIYKYGQYLSGKTDDKPNKNIILPILRLRYRTEGFDVKDIELYVDEPKSFFKSFFIRKFHDKWARENELDTFIDDSIETDIDVGGVLVKYTKEIKPDIVKWQSVAFCDQTDILSGPICIRHTYAPDELKDMEKYGWKRVDEVITYSRDYKKDLQKQGKEARTPGKYVEVYELHGMFPTWWLEEGYERGEFGEEEKYSRQLHICTFYTGQDNRKHGITLFKGEEPESPFRLRTDPIYGRGLGYGGVEELIEDQVWVNYNIIREQGLLDQASKIIYQTADAAFTNRNKTSTLENGEILIYEEGKPISQVNNIPTNINIFNRAISDWETHARLTGGATESLVGESPSAGTPFKLQELVTKTSLGLHTYRMGKFAIFIEKIYREKIIPALTKEITKGKEWLSELSLEDMQYLSDALVECKTQRMIKERILNGKVIRPEETDSFKQMERESFRKGGNKRFLKILKDEMRGAPVDVKINIKGKQKDLVGMVDKTVNVFRTIFANPQGFIETMKIPAMAKAFNDIIEFSGLSPMDFSSLISAVVPPQQNPQSPASATAPLEKVAQPQPTY